MASKMRDRLLGQSGLKSCRTERVAIVQDGDRARIRLPAVDGIDPDQGLELLCELIVREPSLADFDHMKSYFEADGTPSARAIVESVVRCVSDAETGERLTQADVEVLMASAGASWVKVVSDRVFALANKSPGDLGKS